jgi:sRNA-binding regulator protein Hfq
MANRKLIRPTRHEMQDRLPKGTMHRKFSPQAETNAESFYYQKQMNARTPMVFVLNDGEQLHGTIEWYDKSCIKLNREKAPNLLVMKHQIKYLHKGSNGPSRRNR